MTKPKTPKGRKLDYAKELERQLYIMALERRYDRLMALRERIVQHGGLCSSPYYSLIEQSDKIQKLITQASHE